MTSAASSWLGASCVPSLAIRDIVTVTLPQQLPQGGEQEGYRRAVVVGLPNVLGPLRLPVLLIVPFTAEKPHYAWAKANTAAYPRYTAGTAGLTKDSVALIDQLRAVDVSRLGRKIGTMASAEYQPIERGMRRMLGL